MTVVGVNGQFKVPIGGQVKVPTPVGCWDLLGLRATSSPTGLLHAERLAVGDNDDAVMDEPVEQ